MIDIDCQFIQNMIDVRHYLHQNPELSFKEFNTCKFLKQELGKYGISYQEVAETGIVAVVEGALDGYDRVIRADIDALPIVECNNLDYASTNGAMHACGHDIHTTVLLGTLVWLSQNREQLKGRIIGVFQPGEEVAPGGASLILDSGVLDGYDIKAAYALHTAHDMPVGEFGVKIGEYMASTAEMRVEVCGVGGHAALIPDDDNTITDVAQIILKISEISSKYSNSILKFGNIITNSTTNIVPINVIMEGTVRAMAVSKRKEIEREIIEVVKSIAPSSKISFSSGYPPIYNNEDLATKCLTVLSDNFGEGSVKPLNIRMTADDFGFFSERYPSFYYRLGVSEGVLKDSNPHTPYYIASDNSIEYGIKSMILLISQI